MKTQKRMISTGVWENGYFAKLPVEARLLFICTITLGDDDGRVKGSAAYLRSACFPYDEDITVADVAKWRDQIAKYKLFEVYEVDGFEYIAHPNWTKFQNLRNDRYHPSDIPAPVGSQDDNQTGAKTSPLGLPNITKQNTTKQSKEALLTSFAAFWDVYPRKVGKPKALKVWQRINPDPVLVEQIMSGLERCKRSTQWTKDGNQYVPHPTTWLNREGWNDDDGKPTATRKVDRL